MYASTDMKTRPGEYREIGQTLGLGPEVSPRQMPPIGIAVEQLEKELYGLQEVIHALEQRLSPVTRPVPESMGKDQIQSGGGSPLANQLEAYCHMVRRASANVRALIDCLEL